jgi:hypothetical protein
LFPSKNDVNVPSKSNKQKNSLHMYDIPYTVNKNDEKAIKKISYNSPRVKISHVSTQAFNAGARVDAA